MPRSRTPVSPMTRAALSWLALVAGCAQAPPPIPAPPSGRVIPAPETSGKPELDAPMLTHLMRGLHFLASGYPGAAVPHLRLALIYDPESPFIHERLFIAWGLSGDLERARATLLAGLEKAPDHPGLNLMQGELLLRDQLYADARPHLERALADATRLHEAAPALAEARAWVEPLPAAATWAQGVAAQHPGNARLAAGLAEVLEDHGGLESALFLYRAAHAQDPGNDVIAFHEARVLELMGRPMDAADALVALFAHHPDDVSLMVEVARLYQRAGSQDAAAYRAEALSVAEGDPDALMRVAAGDLLEGRTEAGIAALRRLVLRYPEHASSRLLLAEQLMARGDAKGCLDVLPRALGGGALLAERTRCLGVVGKPDELLLEAEASVRASAAPGEQLQAAALAFAQAAAEPEAEELLRELVRRTEGLYPDEDVLLAEVTQLDFWGRGDEALSLLQRLLSEEPAPGLRLRWADFLARYGHTDRAVSELEALLKQGPEDPSRMNALGFTLADANRDLRAAEVWIRRAYRLLPDQGFVIDSLGWLLHRQGHQAAALALLQRADAASPGDVEILRHKGDVLAALGRNPEARAAWEHALALRPSAPQRAQLLSRLRGGV